MANVSLLFHIYPHYRVPIMRELALYGRHNYTFFGGLKDFQGIKAFTGNDDVSVEEITFNGDEASGKMAIADYDAALSHKFDATIILGNPNVHQTWAACLKARRNGLKVAFWAHGWLREKESWPKAKLRNFYYGLADRVLTYSSRAVGIAGRTGFNTDSISVIYNSLDWETQSRHYDTLKEQPLPELRASLGLPANAAILLTISRVTDLCRYDWLIEAAGAINTQGRPLTIVMIGDGPALPALKAQAEQLGVDLRCTGALYDEAVIAAHVMASDVVVSPGKVGLTAMHALAYGTPIVSHSDLDRQMPEIEAVIEGQSGALFPFGSVSGLAEAISSVLASSSSPARRREACRAALIGRFTPQDQRRLIDDAVDRMLAR